MKLDARLDSILIHLAVQVVDAAASNHSETGAQCVPVTAAIPAPLYPDHSRML